MNQFDCLQNSVPQIRYNQKILKEQGSPIPTNDVWIAATALEKGAKLATYDAHFNNIAGIINLNPKS